jgi:3-oxoacyl-[acyl-carrier protein] reductase
MSHELSSQHDLAGQVAVVTGSSTGIGRATAWELAKAGAAVVIHARGSWQEAQQLAEQIEHAGGHATVILADLADPAEHERFVEVAWSWRDGIDVWVNNAGADVLTGDMARWSFEEKLNVLWQVDVTAAMRLSRLVGARMRARGRGVIVNTGWDQVEHGMAGDSGELFAAIKGAVMAFSKSLARSLAPQVRVNCVAPGWIRTEWGDQASEFWQNRARRESLLERWGEPSDVAQTVRWLVSPAAAFITGQIVNVNGGFRHSGN